MQLPKLFPVIFALSLTLSTQVTCNSKSNDENETSTITGNSNDTIFDDSSCAAIEDSLVYNPLCLGPESFSEAEMLLPVPSLNAPNSQIPFQAPSSPPPIVEAFETARTNHEMGFLVFRTVYDDEEKWTRFRSKWEEIYEAKRKAKDDWEPRMRNKINRIKFIWVEDKGRLNDAGPDEVRSYFLKLKKSHEAIFPFGYDTSAVLLVSKDSVSSLLNSSPSRQDLPFAIVVDVYYSEEGDHEDYYFGHFRAWIQVLLCDLFDILSSNILTPFELAATLDTDDEVWMGH